MSRQRLFFALCPDEALRRELAALACALPPGSGKPVTAENLHLTLVFLGNVDEVERARALEAGAAVRASGFEIVLDRLGGFRRTAVTWSSCSTIPEGLDALVTSLRDALHARGFAFDQRRFHPHVTLARRARRLVSSGPHRALGWPVRAFVLVRSQTLREGARHEVVGGWPLQGSRAASEA